MPDEEAVSWKIRGDEFVKIEKYEDAIKCYEKAINLDPDYLSAWNNIGYSLSKLGRKDEAKEIKKKIEELRKALLSTKSNEPIKKEPPSTAVSSEIEKSISTESYTIKEEKAWCLNCGAELPYSKGHWPPGFPRLCPKCGIRVQDPIKYGQREGQGRTHPEQLKYPGLAALLSIIPGMGQIYNGQLGKGLLFLFGTTLFMFGSISESILVVPGLVIWLYGIYDAYKTAKKMNYGDIPFKEVKLSHSAAYFVSIIFCFLIMGGIASNLNNLSAPTDIPQSSMVRPTPIIIPTNRNPTTQNVKILQDILTKYHSTHTYIGPDIYVCGDMASDVWNMVETRGINAILTVGNVDTKPSSIEEANHVWVLAEISPDNWIAMETTGGYLVCDNQNTCPISNQLYYYGWNFNNPKELKDALENLRHPCPDGYILGNDQLCHPACGGAHYCTGNSICVNGQCMGCSEGYLLGEDLRCHEECPIGSGRYCEYGVCGNDGLCYYY